MEVMHRESGDESPRFPVGSRCKVPVIVSIKFAGYVV